ncbi:MAG: hypothetical protein HY783_09655 [Chloroflexi bacterium]|nr:hypothetical protein [Chloroflexota bacterium]
MVERVSQTEGMALAMACHSTWYVLVKGIGLFFLGRENLSFGRLTRMGEWECSASGGSG